MLQRSNKRRSEYDDLSIRRSLENVAKAIKKKPCKSSFLKVGFFKKNKQDMYVIKRI